MRVLSILILTLAALGVKGQATQPFKGANKIIFECQDSGEDLYIRLGKHLISKGYTIIADKDFLNIRTKSRSISDLSHFVYTVNSIVENNKVSFTIDVTDGSSAAPRTIAWRYAAWPGWISENTYEHFLEHMAGFEKLNVYYEKY